jgi:hypothetical protein
MVPLAMSPNARLPPAGYHHYRPVCDSDMPMPECPAYPHYPDPPRPGPAQYVGGKNTQKKQDPEDLEQENKLKGGSRKPFFCFFSCSFRFHFTFCFGFPPCRADVKVQLHVWCPLDISLSGLASCTRLGCGLAALMHRISFLAPERRGF